MNAEFLNTIQKNKKERKKEEKTESREGANHGHKLVVNCCRKANIAMC